MFGTIAAVQNAVWGATNSSKDALCTQWLTIATSMIMKEFRWDTEPTTVDDPVVAQTAILLAAGFIQAKENPDRTSQLLTQGLALLSGLRGEDDQDTEWGVSFAVQRE